MITGRRVLESCPPIGLAVESEAAVIGAVRTLAVGAANAQGFAHMHVERVSGVATAMATDLVSRAGSARIFVQLVEMGDLRGVEIVGLSGPEKGPSTVTDGTIRSTEDETLAAIARVADLFDVYSVVERGTAMVARFWGGMLSGASNSGFAVGSMTEAFPGEVVSGDAWGVEQQGDRIVALVADGLGHGVEAEAAATIAVQTFRQHNRESAEDIARLIHGELRATRGAAIAIAEIDADAGRVRFCGIGNISARLIVAGREHQLVSLFGIAGYRSAKVRAFESEWEKGALLVVHTDGLSPSWNFGPYRDLGPHHPQLAAATVMRDAPRADDDALVLTIGEADRVITETQEG